MIKLLAGLYPDYDGKILVNGKDLQTFTQEQRCRLLSCVWQDYVKYGMTVKENLCFEKSHEDTEIQKVLSFAGLLSVVEKLPKGIDTVLGKVTEEGTDLSEGQWQRLAIARAMMHEGKILVLDEPTAALDPIVEHEVYCEFMNASRNKTTIFITHRLGAIKEADEIFVLENGIVTENGTHQELMQKQGTYANMYESQQGWYL